MRPVTATMRLRFSRSICGWPLTGVRVAMRLSGTMCPSSARNSRCSRAACDDRIAGGVHTRTPTMATLPRTAVVTSPLTAASTSLVAASGVIPSSDALIRSIRISSASPAGITPSLMSTTPRTFPSAAATFPAVASSMRGSSANNFTSIGCGTAVRSPITSSSSCINSICRPGTFFSTSPRISSITWSIGGRDPRLRRMKKSPSLASVSPPPSWAPVRRE